MTIHVGPGRNGHPRHPCDDRAGYTLIELLMVLIILGLLLAVALQPLLRWRDRAAVRAARDELAGALAWTRTAAVSTAGATLVLDVATGRFWVEAEVDTIATPVDLWRRYGVRVDAGGVEQVGFHYDALGIGRLSNRTVRIGRRAAEAGLTVSAYGRVRRW